jgi:signal transduction histidine kinase
MTEIIARIDALNQLVKDLLLFARPPQPRPTAVDVSALVITTASLLRADAAHEEIRVEVSGETPPAMADAELLKIVFLNLLINSAQAMHGKGVIQVSVTSADSACHVAIVDSGPGIPLGSASCSPFVTTKPVERDWVCRRSSGLSKRSRERSTWSVRPAVARP